MTSRQGGAGRQGGRTGGRDLTVRVKTARSRAPSSTRWLERQLNDPYVADARRLGYRSRAAFKLRQLDERFGLLRPGLRVVDLGAAPGGWTQIAVAAVRPGEGRGRVVAADHSEMAPVDRATVLQLDVFDPAAIARIAEALGGPADLVLSDMAPATTGHAATDHLRIMGLAEAAWEVAEQILAPGGTLVCKLFQGGADRELLERLRRAFTKVRHAKPPASRAESSETYLVATGFRGGAGPDG